MRLEQVITLDDDEEVLAVLRSHWVTRLGKIVVALTLVVAPFFAMVPLFKLGGWGVAAFTALVGLGLFYAFRAYHLWHWNAFIVTDTRVVDIDQRGWFRRQVSEVDFDRVQDVSFTVHGLMGSLFGYGSIVVQTAGASLVIELADVADPKQAHRLITTAMSERRRGGGGTGFGGNADGGKPGLGGRSRRVQQLLDAAAELDPAEARAFINAVQKAATRPAEPPPKPDTEWLEDDGEDKTRLKH